MGPESVAERCIAFVFSRSAFLRLIRIHFTMNFESCMDNFESICCSGEQRSNLFHR